MVLSRRSFVRGLIGVAAAPLVACSTTTQPLLPPRLHATVGPVMNPADIGFDAVVDISHHAMVTDFAAARYYSNIRGVLHKATEGYDWVDPLYAARRQQAENAGLFWGAYHFGTHQYSGADQATAFLAVAQPGPTTLLALDLELNERSPANSMDLSQAEEFVAAIEAATGRLPLLYVHPAWADGETHKGTGRSLGAAIDPQSNLARCDLWLADYRMEPELPRSWSSRGWRLWQYAGDYAGVGAGPFGPLSLTVAGISACDRNVFQGDEVTLGRYWTGQSQV